jgi:small subunit ribosomal protein S16
MPAKIRLQRHGKKGRPIFHIVIADSRTPRDGKFIERIGTYNPNTNPATIELNFEKTLTWYQNGAQPSDTARAILAYKGILMKDHLLRGVKKGALTAEQAEAKFAKWLEEKDGKINSKKDSLKGYKADEYKKRMASEAETRNKKIAAKAAKAEPAVEEAAPAAEEGGEAPAEA